jgi:hypothetical protein
MVFEDASVIVDPGTCRGFDLASAAPNKSLIPEPIDETRCRQYGNFMSANYAIRDNVEKHRFEADLGDGTLSIANYYLRAGKIVVTHTEVPPSHEGQGIGTALIRFALKSIRDRGLKLVPLCPFFADYVRKHPEEQDLLDSESRTKLGLE